MAEDTVMVEELLAQCQEAYEEAGGRNPPPLVDREFQVVIKSVKLRTFKRTDDDSKTAVLVPVLEITNEDYEEVIMDGDGCSISDAGDLFSEINMGNLKRLATVLNNGVPFPNVRDAWEAVKGCAGASLIYEVKHGTSKKGKPYYNVSPKEKL